MIIDPIPFTSSHPQSAPKVRDRESVIPVSCVNLSSDDRDLAQKLEAIAQVGLSLKKSIIMTLGQNFVFPRA